MGIARTAREAASLAVLLVAYAASHVVPSKPGLWVHGADAGDRFVGNPKYLFLQLAEEHDDVRPVWLSADPSVVEAVDAAGYEAHGSGSLRGLYLTLRAEYVLVSHGPADVTWWATGGASVVQLWHGVPLKRIGDDLDRDWSLPGRLLYRLTGSDWSRLVVTGETLTPIFARAYHQDGATILPTGYPRNDVLGDDVPDATLGLDDDVVERVRSLSADHRVAAYMPTWRRWGADVQHGTPLTDSPMDFERLEELLAERDAYLLLKLHPRAETDVDLATLDHVIELPAGFDLYPVLDEVDVLVTDYSSVYFDYLHLDRPVVFYPYDREAYADQPGFYFPYESVTPGPTPTTFDGFREALGDALDGEDAHADERAAVRSRFFDHEDGRAAERLYERLAA